MEKYDKDMEAMDIKIQRMKTKHITTIERREELEATVINFYLLCVPTVPLVIPL